VVRTWRALGLGVAAAALIRASPAVAGAPSDQDRASAKVQLLDVPYVPQSEALCGGAALAMVLRYWGKPGVLAEDFADRVDPGGAGIRTGALAQAAATDGWIALPLPGTPAAIQDQLAQGRPIIALIRVRSGYHYVVLLSWANGWVILHDPSEGPFRTVPEEEFVSAWLGGESWSLLVLPPPATAERNLRDVDEGASFPSAVRDACDDMVAAGVLLARQGDTSGAERELLAAQLRCPDSASPLRERAGLRFLAEDWAGAASLAESTLALAPDDDYARRLLAGSRFLGGDEEGALAAWNHLSEPRVDLTRIRGLERIRHSIVAAQLRLPPGRLLTPGALRQARRRLAELPARSESRLDLRPAAEGIAQVDVVVLERPPVPGGARDLGSAGVRALVGHEIALDVASPTGNGELWSARWRWWENRPSVSVALAIPAAGGRPGVWRLTGLRERQSYSIATTPTEVIREDRRRTALSFSDWLAPDCRAKIGAALDAWSDRGAHLSLEGSVETRWSRDRLALGATLARWVSLEAGTPFGAGDLSARWSSSGLQRCDAWQGGLGISTATSRAPLALWSGAGTGYGRAPLLRAHPLLRDGGIVGGGVFGRTLLHGTVERQTWPWMVGPLQLGCAAFLDGARPWGTGAEGPGWQVDGGAGLRLRALGGTGRFRIDAARGLVDGSTAVSVAWQIP
jgi:hypothetical protein